MLSWIIAIALFALPVLELTVLIKTGQLIGFWATLALVVGAGILGAAVLSRQSLTVLRQTQTALEEGRAPIGPALDGAFLLLAGVLLMLPGLVSDAVALLLLIPPLRRLIARWSARYLLAHGNVQIWARRRERSRVRAGPDQSNSRDAGSGAIIEGEFERLGERSIDDPPRRDQR
jgi:UPF0716 protein FxsA